MKFAEFASHKSTLKGFPDIMINKLAETLTITALTNEFNPT